jgi:hypothetical protein
MMKELQSSIVGDESMAEAVNLLKAKLDKKNEALARTRLQLARARKEVDRLKNIVSYQRQRIIQLYK